MLRGCKAWELCNGYAQVSKETYPYGKRDLPDGKKRPTKMQTACLLVLRPVLFPYSTSLFLLCV